MNSNENSDQVLLMLQLFSQAFLNYESNIFSFHGQNLQWIENSVNKQKQLNIQIKIHVKLVISIAYAFNIINLYI